ncbi:anti-sigma factor [Nibrella saemangeumensis]|uniref:Regulator of SigK n=1 Tax=Nibrella saemangeumensis TaxID=1084526 RepID=A0ABP8MTT2_9BACT
MNIPEYLTSGILESYVLGAVSDEERREVECLSSIYPEIRQELDRLSAALEDYALSYSALPPIGLKEQIMAKLDFGTEAPPVETETPVVALPADSGPTYKITWIAAASLGLLVLIFSFFLLSQLRQAQRISATLRDSNETLQTEIQRQRDIRQRSEDLLAMLRQPEVRIIRLKGNDKAPTGEMMVYWHPHSRQVMVEIMNMPPLPANQQYQLWSLVNGQPVDAGVFDVTDAPQKMGRVIAQADAFAVTIEKRGGSPAPTLSSLVMMTPVTS